MLGNWKIVSSSVQGDISYELRKIFVTPIYVDLELTIYSDRFAFVDILFEYRENERDAWRQDAIITQTTTKYLRGNRLLGLTASQYGETHSIRWKYSVNEG